MEDGSDFGIHLDVEALGGHNLLVPLVHLLRHPFREGILEDGGAHVGYPLFGKLRDLLFAGQEMAHLVVWGHELGDLLDGEVVVLRNGDMAHVLAHDPLATAADQILQEENCNLLCQI